MINYPTVKQVGFWLHRSHRVRDRIVREYLAGTAEPMLELGAGTNRLPGWLHADIYTGDIYIDLTKPMPLPDSSFAYINSEQVIEHLPEQALTRLLPELRRILRPGGVMRLSTPDLARLVEVYLSSARASHQEFAAYLNTIAPGPHDTRAQVLNSVMRSWGHQFIYDEEDLTRKLYEAGFAQVKRCAAGQSDHAALRNVERHDSPTDDLSDALIIEAA